MTAPRILVTGATGSTGREAVRVLARGGHHVRALIHRPDPRADVLGELGAEVVTGDLLDIDDVRAALEGVEAAYFVYPLVPGILEATAAFAQAAHEAGVRAVVDMSQLTARRASVSHAARDHWISQQVFDWCGIPVTHLRPNLFAEWLLYPFTRRPLVAGEVLALPFGEARFTPLTAHDQGRVIAAILADPGPHAGRTYPLDGPVTMDGTGMAAALTEALGHTITYSPVPLADFQAAVTAIPVLGPFFAQHIGGVVDDLGRGLWATSSDTVEEITGKPPMSIEEFARDHRDELTRP